MNQALYEMLYIVDSSLGGSEVERYQKEIRELITQSGGEIRKEGNWGNRKLAYEIRKKTEGAYTNIEFYSNSDVPKQIQQYVNTHVAVLRHLVIKVPKAKLLQEKQDAEKERKKLEEARKEREELAARQEAAAQAEAKAQEEAAAQAEAKAQEESSAVSEEPEAKPATEEQTASTESVSQPVEASTESGTQETSGVSAENDQSTEEKSESEKTE